MFTNFFSGVFLIAAGVIVAGLGTVAQQISVTWIVPIPIGLILALLAFAALITGLRLLAHTRIPALLTGLGAIGTVVLFAMEGAGGSVLVPNNLQGQVWLGGSILVAAVILAWPDLEAGRTKSGSRNA